jgi:hypothetical protein
MRGAYLAFREVRSMRRVRVAGVHVVAIAALTVLAGGCGSTAPPARAPGASPSVTPSAGKSAAAYRPLIKPAEFTTHVTNRYFPLSVGSHRVYDGAKDGKPQHVEVTVERATRTIMGVPCVVVSDVVTSNNTLVEKTSDWFAQDRAGNIWYFGEDSKDYTNGVVTSTHGTWEAGVDGAQPGIIMPSAPRAGQRYRQEYLPGVAVDQARVVRTDDVVGLPGRTYRNVVLTEDTDPLNPDLVQHKWYAAGVGQVKVVRTGSSHHEDLHLTSVRG